VVHFCLHTSTEYGLLTDVDEVVKIRIIINIKPAIPISIFVEEESGMEAVSVLVQMEQLRWNITCSN